MCVNEYGTMIHSVSGQLVCMVKAGTLVWCQLLMFQCVNTILSIWWWIILNYKKWSQDCISLSTLLILQLPIQSLLCNSYLRKLQ